MANRFWVGGSASWDGTAGTKWALTSGGAGGQAVPTSSDDVFFDAASGSVTITLSGAQVCNNFNTTGFIGTFAGGLSTFAISGSVILGGLATYTNSHTWVFNATGAQTIQTNGVTLVASFNFTGVGGARSLLDNLNLNGVGITLTAGSFDTGGFNITMTGLGSNNSNVRSLILRNSTLTLTSAAPLSINPSTNMSLDAGTSTLVINNASASPKSFTGGGLTYYNILCTGAGTGNFFFTGGANTFNKITVDTPPHTVQFTALAVQTIGTLDISGVPGSLNSISSGSAGVQATIIVNSAFVYLDYVNIQDSAATGTARFYAGPHSVSTSNNTGWKFISSLSQTVTLVDGIQYAFTATITSVVGKLDFVNGLVTDVPIHTWNSGDSATVSFIFTAGSSDSFFINAYNGFLGSITSISISIYPADTEDIPYNCVMRMAYRNHGRRQGLIAFDKTYIEGYMTEGTELDAFILYDYQGSKDIQNVVVNSTDHLAKFYSGVNSPSIGDSSLGDNPLGDGIIDDPTDQELLPKFRAICDTNIQNIFEYQIVVYSSTLDSRWEIICLGTNAKMSANQQAGFLNK